MAVGSMNPFNRFRRVESSTSQTHFTLDDPNSKTPKNQKPLTKLVTILIILDRDTYLAV